MRRRVIGVVIAASVVALGIAGYLVLQVLSGDTPPWLRG
jgi:hypothetical protein